MVNYNSDSESTSALWNLDDSENRLIFELKLKFVDDFKVWNLEASYWDLIVLHLEADALIKDDDRQEFINKLDKITKFRNENKNFMDDEELKMQFYSLMHEFYLDLCRKIVDEGLYFRKKRNYMGL